MKKQLCTVLAAAVLTAAVAGTAEATLTTIGTASYNNGTYNLIWDNDGPNGSTVWLDYTNAGKTWGNQIAWASGLGSNLTINLNAGYSVNWSDSAWRLPSTVDDSAAYSGTLPDNFWYSGAYSRGYNNTTSEFGHLYYTELGNKAEVAINGSHPQPGFGLVNDGPFVNLQSYWYWSGTETSYIPDRAWYFKAINGYQGIETKDDTVNVALLGMAVRSGQVEASPVPEPSTMLLLGGGLIGLAGWRLRKRGR